jgi:hypothetical protein
MRDEDNPFEYVDKNWHKLTLRDWWGEACPGLQGGSVEECVEKVAAIYAEQRGKPLNTWKMKRDEPYALD